MKGATLFYTIALLILAPQTGVAAPSSQQRAISAPNWTGQGISIHKTPQGSWVLSSASCRSLIKALNNIRDWTRSLEDQPGEIPPLSPKNGRCEAIIDSIIPAYVRGICGTYSQCDGPNCFNSCLFAKGMANTLRSSTEEEFRFWMESPYCTKVRSKEAIRPGDIMVVRRQKSDDISPERTHVFIYIDNGLSFSKNGMNSDNPWHFYPTEQVLGIYGLKPGKNFENCSKAVSATPPSRKNCPSYVEYFHCKNFDESQAIAAVPATSRRALMGVASQLRQTECMVSDWAVRGKEFSYLINAGAVAHQIESFKQVVAIFERLEQGDPKTTFRFWTLLKLRVQALENQLKGLEPIRHTSGESYRRLVED